MLYEEEYLDEEENWEEKVDSGGMSASEAGFLEGYFEEEEE